MANTGNTQQIINYGATANDGTGDPLRTAFIKTDDNFDNVWLAGPVGSNITIGNNTIQSNNTNGNIIIKPNGTGIVQANASILPNADNTRDLGSSTLAWRRAYINELLPENLTVSGDATIGGNLTVEGDTIQIGNITTDTLTVQLANTAANRTAANGAGVTVGANDAIATFLFNSTTDTWTTNIGANVAGNVTALRHISNVVRPDGNITGSCGTADHIWQNVRGNVLFANTIQDVFGSGQIQILSNLTAFNFDTGNIGAGNISVANNVSVLQNLNVKTGTFTGDATGTNSIYAGVPLFTVLGSDVVAQFSGNVDSYTQFNFQNGNSGTLASGDYVITADNGDDDTFFFNMGLGSSNHDDPDFFGDTSSPNDAYIYVVGADATGPGDTGPGNLLIGSTNGVIKMFVGNTAQANVVQTISTTGVSVTGNVTANYFLGNIQGAVGNITNLDSLNFAVENISALIGNNGVNIGAGGFNNIIVLPTEVIVQNVPLTVAGNIIANETNGLYITANAPANGTAQVWNFGTDGNLTLPYGAVIRDTSGNAVAFGLNAGLTNQNNYAVAIGPVAGANAQGVAAVAIGSDAGQTSQGIQAIAIGTVAGANTQGLAAVAVGPGAGQTSQGQFAVAIGASAGDYTQGPDAVAIGYQAGQTSQGEIAVAIGHLAGNASQGNAAVAVGASAGANTQGVHAVAIGTDSGATTQGNRAVAIGYLAGSTAQGTAAVAIGYYAGELNQGNNSIIINATDTALQQTTANTFTVAPIRNDVANVAEILFYDTTSKEITYGNTISVAGNITGGNISTTGNITGADVVSANTFVSNAFNVVTAGNLSITSQYGLGFTGTILEDNGTLELIGSGGGGVVVGWDSTYGNGLGNIATVNFNEVGGEGILLRTGNRAATEYNWNFDSTGNLTLPGNVTGNTNGFAIGYRDIPQVSFTGNATIATADAGKHFYSTQSTDYVLTIANNASQGFQTGAAITVINQGTGNITLAQGSGVTLYLTGNATSGNRTVTTFGMATLIKVATDTWFVSGAGVI